MPVALVTDLKPARIANKVHSESRGRVWLHFETLVREVSREEYSAWAGARNAIAQALRGAMAGPQSRAEKVFRGAEALKGIVSPEEYRNLFTLAAEVGKLTFKEVEAYMKKTQLRSEALEWLESQAQARGEQAKAIATARNLLEHGVSWDIITSSTGLKSTELKKLAKPASARKLAKK